MNKTKFHYGWVIVAACCVVMAASMGIVSNCASLFIKPISEDLGVSRRSVSTMLSISSIGGMITSFFAGKIFKEENIIRIMKVAILVIGASFFMNSFITNVRFFYVTAAINGVCMTLLTVMPVTFIINNWFKENVGFALGLASMGSGLGGAVFNSMAGKWITRYGWRMTYRILAVSLLVLAIPCIYFIIKLKPSDLGMEPYNKVSQKELEKRRAAQEKPADAINTGMTLAEAKKTTFFYGVCACAICLGICMNSMYNSIAPRLQDIGYSLTFSANFLSVGMFIMAFGKIILGKIFDIFGVRIAFTIACSSLLAAIIGLLFASFTPALGLVLVGILFGVVFGAVCFPLAIPLIFGKKDYKAIMGPISAMLSLGGAIGPTISGRIYDKFGSYNMAYIICSVIMIVVIAYFWKLLPDKEHQAQ